MLHPSYRGVILGAHDAVGAEERDTRLEEYLASLTANPEDEQARARVINTSTYNNPITSTQMGRWWWAHAGAPYTT
eukprot:4536037-Pyramimonas_sp.AAC.1